MGWDPPTDANLVFGLGWTADPVKREGRELLLPVCVEGEKNPMRVVLDREVQDGVFGYKP